MCTQEGGRPLQATPAIQKASDGILSLDLAHNLPHSSCQDWYSGLISSLLCCGSGSTHPGLRGDPRGCRAGGQGFHPPAVCSSHILVDTNRPEAAEGSPDDCSLLLPTSRPV